MNPKLNKLIITLSRSIGQRRLYFANHPLIKRYCAEIVGDLRSVLADFEEKSLFIGIVEGQLVHDGHYLVGPSIMGQQLLNFAKKLHCGGLALDEDTTVHEVQMLLDLADEMQAPIDNLQEARKILRARGVLNITLGAHYAAPSALIQEDDKEAWQGKDNSGHLHSPLLVYQALFDVVTKAHGDVSLDRAIDINGTQSVSEQLLYSTRDNYTDMMQFVRYPDYDSYTVGHSVRVATLAVFVGDHLGLDDEQLLDLGTAALLHDVGKSKVPAEILFKPDRLTEDEFAIMRYHARMGAEILLENADSTPLQIAAAWGHHLRFDGGGYPPSPSWAVRSHLVSLLQICDVFEALTAVRPYKEPLSPLVAFSIMIGDKGAFNPALLHTFISTLGLFPPGNNVRLNNGCEAVVVAAGTSIDKPVVRLTKDQKGNPLGKNEQRIVHLEEDPSATLAVTELVIKESP